MLWTESRPGSVRKLDRTPGGISGTRGSRPGPQRDVENWVIDVLEIRRRVLDGGIESWGEIDTAAVWEPNVSSFQLAGLTRNLTETHELGAVAVSDEFISEYPEATVQFLVALVRAWDFFSKDPERVMRWYDDDTQLDYEREGPMTAVKIDSNLDATSLREINLELSEKHVAILEKSAAWGGDAWEDGSRIRQFKKRVVLGA